MKRADLATANQWLNDPRILPFHHHESIDLAPIWADCVVYEFDTGTVGFHHMPSGEWGLHLCLIPGRWNAIAKVRRAIDAIFLRDDCDVMVGLFHPHNKVVRKLGHCLGFTPDGVSNGFERMTLTRKDYQNGMVRCNR